MQVLISLCETVERSYSKTHHRILVVLQKCILIQQLQKEGICTVWQKKIPWCNGKNSVCYYVKVYMCICSGCFEEFIIYISLCFSKRAYSAAVHAERWGLRSFNHCLLSSGGHTKGSEASHDPQLSLKIQTAASAPVNQSVLCDFSLSDFDFWCIPLPFCTLYG